MNRASTWIAGGILALCATLGVAVLVTSESPALDNVCPDGKCKPKTPTPLPKKPDAPPKRPKPQPRPCPSTLAGYQAVGLVGCVSEYLLEGEEDKQSWVNGREAEGEVLTADFPGTLYMQNIGSHKDGAGMCVMTSITMCAKYLGLTDYYGLRDWCANEPGGAYRQKVDDQIKRYEQAMGITNPVPYLQYEGPHPEAVLAALDKARLPFAHTYGWSPRYHSRIMHMVTNTKWNGRYSCVLDSNPMSDFDPLNNKIFEWMSREEMIRRGKLGQGGNIWIFAWLAPPPPPCPKVGK